MKLFFICIFLAIILQNFSIYCQDEGDPEDASANESPSKASGQNSNQPGEEKFTFIGAFKQFTSNLLKAKMQHIEKFPEFF